jgi:hypothetical protein
MALTALMRSRQRREPLTKEPKFRLPASESFSEEAAPGRARECEFDWVLLDASLHHPSLLLVHSRLSPVLKIPSDIKPHLTAITPQHHTHNERNEWRQHGLDAST